MSYILEALKKSEKERRRGSIPDPLTIQETPSHRPGRRALWPYLIMVALILNAAVFAVWSGLIHTKKPVRITETISGRPETINENRPSLPAAVKDEGSEVGEENSGRAAAPPLEAIIANNEKNIRQKEPVKTETDTKKKAQDYPGSTGKAGKEHVIPPIALGETTLVHPSAEVKSSHVAVPMPNRIYTPNELPLPVRKDLPEFLVSVFLYSDDPASRLVRINGQMMKEGQYLSPGLKLEEIVPSGVIFSYQNYRFLIGPK
jgi:general secretion pathway protein B